MGFDWKYEDSDKLEVFLGNLETDCQQVGERIQKKSAEVIKDKMISQLNRIRTSINKPNYKHMADDVVTRTVKDKWGDTIVKVSGGKKTGTLWHLVNDGMYTTKPTHFMDKGMAEAEQEVLAIIDKELSKVGD